MKKYETVIGLEIHVELSTETKIFCNCRNSFGDIPNSNVCPVCLSMPGTLPVLNQNAVELGVRAGIIMNCEISNYSRMDRKNYTYPDLAKSYQISQFDYPLCKNGFVVLDMGSYCRRIGIIRIHIEEDAGKLIHEDGLTYVDYNRGGVPLIEIVTEPDFRSSEEVKSFLNYIRTNMEFAGVSDCKMQEGSLRCDINVSVREAGTSILNTRVELKNINSITSAAKAIVYESERQIDCYEHGKDVVQETRKWDDTRNATAIMRSKEDSQDYRYFPEPDLVPIVLSDEDIEIIRDSMPVLPDVKREYYISALGLSEYDSDIMVSSRHIARFFDECVSILNEPKIICNFVMVDLQTMLKEQHLDFNCCPVKPKVLCEIVACIKNGTISSTVAKSVLKECFETGESPNAIIAKKGLKQIDDDNLISEIICDLINKNPVAVEDYKRGNKKAIAFFVGKVMKSTQGKANPSVVNRILINELQNK